MGRSDALVRRLDYYEEMGNDHVQRQPLVCIEKSKFNHYLRTRMRQKSQVCTSRLETSYVQLGANQVHRASELSGPQNN